MESRKVMAAKHLLLLCPNGTPTDEQVLAAATFAGYRPRFPGASIKLDSWLVEVVSLTESFRSSDGSIEA